MRPVEEKFPSRANNFFSQLGVCHQVQKQMLFKSKILSKLAKMLNASKTLSLTDKSLVPLIFLGVILITLINWHFTYKDEVLGPGAGLQVSTSKWL